MLMGALCGKCNTDSRQMAIREVFVATATFVVITGSFEELKNVRKGCIVANHISGYNTKDWFAVVFKLFVEAIESSVATAFSLCQTNLYVIKPRNTLNVSPIRQKTWPK